MRIGLPVPFLIPIFRLGIRRFAVRPSLAFSAFMLVATGCIGPTSGRLSDPCSPLLLSTIRHESEDPLRAIKMGPFLDRRVRLTVIRLISDVDSGTLAAVIVNFEGQNLRADSINMNFEPTVTGTLQDILAGVSERY